MSTEENKELIRRVAEEVYSKGNAAAVDRYYAPDWVLHDAPPNAGGSRQALKEVLGVRPSSSSWRRATSSRPAPEPKGRTHASTSASRRRESG
jgi:hypothetical protein